MTWYENLPKISSAKFNHENSGASNNMYPPYAMIYGGEDNLEIQGIKGLHGMGQVYKIVGYTDQPPVQAHYPCIAVMFEAQDNFENIWWHFPKE